MSGTRTRTGCYTCRLRKKKCDEVKPSCQNCRSRQIHCYGYGTRPEWMRHMGSWAEVMQSSEAKAVRESAEKTFQLRRRAQKKSVSTTRERQDTSQSTYVPAKSPASPQTESRQQDSNWKRMLWHDYLPQQTWPNASFKPTCSKRLDTKLLTMFLDLIFPLQFGFHGLSGLHNRDWLLRTVLDSEPFYNASLGVSATFEARERNRVLQKPPELDAVTRTLQLGALQGLQERVRDLNDEKIQGMELIQKAMQALAIMSQLLSIEVFTFLEGQWRMHLQAARVILGLFQHKWIPEFFTEKTCSTKPQTSISAARTLMSSHDRKTFEFFVTSFVWVDVIAGASHGPSPTNPMHFDALLLLKNGTLRPQEVMGCQSCILMIIAEITALEAWKEQQEKSACLSMIELVSRAVSLGHRLDQGIKGLEGRLRVDEVDLKEDSEMVNLVFAHGALVYLHTIVAGFSPHVPEIKASVTRCLERIEVLPPRLLMRVCWPFTVAGSMASESQYARFRIVVATATDSKARLGTIWKGLKVMEECWRLRKEEPSLWNWRSTMVKMNTSVLLL